MIDVYCDESHDKTSYALAGWIASPASWDCVTPAWRAMLRDLGIEEFHAAEIVGRDTISDSRFKGWSRAQEVEAFTRAVNLLVDRSYCPDLRAIGCSVSIPGLQGAEIEFPEGKDGIWFFLFTKLFYELFKTFTLSNHSFTLFFDEKKEVRDVVNNYAFKASDLVTSNLPRVQLTVAFGKSINHPPLQAADLFCYEWRKRITDRNVHPQKNRRTSYVRLRESRPASLHHYGNETLQELSAIVEEGRKKHGDKGIGWVEAFMLHKGTEE